MFPLNSYKGEVKKSRLLCLNLNFYANIRPTKTYHIPNEWKFNEDLAELSKFDIAALIEGDNSVYWSPLF